MAIGKNKKKPRKTARTKKIDPFSRKEWYNIRAPSLFHGGTSGAAPGMIGRTCVNKTSGKKLASDALMGRVFSVSLADLNKDSEDQRHRTIKLITDHVQGDTCLTNFYGMRLTTDYEKSLIRKWHSLIEASIEVKTTDGTSVRIFALSFTRRRAGQIKKTSYAQSSQIKALRRKMNEIIVRESSGCDLRMLFEKLCTDVIAKQIEKETASIFPLQHTCIRKAKIVKRPKIDLNQLSELHLESHPNALVKEDIGDPVIVKPLPSENK